MAVRPEVATGTPAEVPRVDTGTSDNRHHVVRRLERVVHASRVERGLLQEHRVENLSHADPVDRVGIGDRGKVQERLHSEYVIFIPQRFEVGKLLDHRCNLAVRPLLNQVDVPCVNVGNRYIVPLTEGGDPQLLQTQG